MSAISISTLPVTVPASGRKVQRQPRPAARTTATPKLSVVIVNYRHWQGTAQLARRILNTPTGRRGLVEVVVVDNHSPKHRLIGKLRRTPGLSLRRWQHNRGFARAVNEGCRLSQGDWFLVLNPDVSVPDGFLENVLVQIERFPVTDMSAGVVGFQLRNSDGSRQWSSGPWPTLLNTITGQLLPRSRRKCRPIRAGRRCRVPWVTGCCLLVRRHCWQQLGGFDEDFFLYYEDVDFCRRATEQGWSVWYEPKPCALHHRPLHSRSVSLPLRLSTRHGLLTYSAKHWPAWQSCMLAWIIQAEGRFRQWWGRWRGNEQEAEWFGRLAALAGDFARGRPQQARRRLDAAICAL